MFETIISTEHISFALVFFEGLLSFLSPCVIPLIPIYMSYLAGNAKNIREDGIITYQRSKVLFQTIFFVLGISSAFFILGMTFTALGSFFQKSQVLFTRIGGILIILMGLIQIGFLDFKFLQRERKFHFDFSRIKAQPVAALLMGFTFSFAWTPCVGPALSSVLILASGAKSNLLGNLLVLVYTIGFTLPFLLLGLFTTQVLNFLKGHQKFLKYTVKAGGVLLILIGVMTFTGWLNSISKYLNSFTPPGLGGSKQGEDFIPDSSETDDNPADESTSKNGSATDAQNETANEDKTVPAINFTLTDQYGNEHTLSDYKGKVVFLNFWATWCPPCKEEMPYIEALYQEYGYNQEDVIFLGVANPANEDYPNNADVPKEEIISFLEENGYTFPVVFDETGKLLSRYFISAFPTTFMVDKEGNILGYIPGSMTRDMMINVIDQTLESTD